MPIDQIHKTEYYKGNHFRELKRSRVLNVCSKAKIIFVYKPSHASVRQCLLKKITDCLLDKQTATKEERTPEV